MFQNDAIINISKSSDRLEYMIHLVAGESALGALRETSVPGDKFSIDDILMEGPVIEGLGSRSSWEYRAERLQRDFSIEKSEYLAGKDERGRILNESLLHDEIVLWFEFDLFCQANLLFYLDWYGSRDLGKTRLSLICPETFAGRPRFRGLGELFAEELESLFPTRAEVTAEQKRVARLAWQSFANDDPRAIEKFLQSDSSVLPRVAPALRAHLERFPSTANGLGILGQKTLEILNEQPVPFHALFPRVVDTPEIFRHGMGDLSLQAYLDMWGSGPNPLVRETDVVEITESGRSVLQERVDAIELNGIDLWYGGVHLTPGNLWRWNSAQQGLVR
jgi:hypothetical protein